MLWLTSLVSIFKIGGTTKKHLLMQRTMLSLDFNYFVIGVRSCTAMSKCTMVLDCMTISNWQQSINRTQTFVRKKQAGRNTTVNVFSDKGKGLGNTFCKVVVDKSVNGVIGYQSIVPIWKRKLSQIILLHWVLKIYRLLHFDDLCVEYKSTSIVVVNWFLRLLCKA